MELFLCWNIYRPVFVGNFFFQSLNFTTLLKENMLLYIICKLCLQFLIIHILNTMFMLCSGKKKDVFTKVLVPANLPRTVCKANKKNEDEIWTLFGSFIFLLKYL